MGRREGVVGLTVRRREVRGVVVEEGELSIVNDICCRTIGRLRRDERENGEEARERELERRARPRRVELG